MMALAVGHDHRHQHLPDVHPDHRRIGRLSVRARARGNPGQPGYQKAVHRSDSFSNSARYLPQMAGSECVPWPRVSSLVGIRM